MPLSHLNDHSAEASRSRVALVAEALETAHVADRPIWIRSAEARIDELERHDFLFGLEQFEADELKNLRDLMRSFVIVS